jgi:urease accessory protein
MKIYRAANTVMRWIGIVFATLAAPSLAYAHVGVGPTSGCANGLLHPLTGPDHVAAMVAVGLWATQRGGRALWLLPLCFVTVMAVGGMIGTLGLAIPFVEKGIVASVLILGVLITAAIRLPLLASSLLVGLFAFFHGHAHGAEMPETVSGLVYGIGFVLATGFLHACGIGLGLAARSVAGPRLVRYAGAATVAVGVYLCFA